MKVLGRKKKSVVGKRALGKAREEKLCYVKSMRILAILYMRGKLEIIPINGPCDWL